jgi:hypothetical protein
MILKNDPTSHQPRSEVKSTFAEMELFLLAAECFESSSRVSLLAIWPASDTYQRCCPLKVPALSTFLQLTAFCFSWATS